MPAEPPPALSPPRQKPWALIIAGVALAGVLVVYPPFRFGSQREGGAADGLAAAAAFAPPAFAQEFWQEQLLPAAERAAEVGPVLAALRRDPAEATRAHAHRIGLGNAAFFFLRGEGRITAVERSRVLVEIDGATVALRTGPVFGNVVRDGSGLLDVNEVPGLTEFNAISAELNRLVEERVQPPLHAAAVVGATVSFAGMAEAPETLPETGPLLTFVPVQVEVKP